MRRRRWLYWLVAGALMGLGLVAPGFGLLPTVVGVLAVWFVLPRWGPAGIWWTLIGCGGAPALLLLVRLASAADAAQPSGPLLLFVAVALAGVVWGVLASRARPR